MLLDNSKPCQIGMIVKDVEKSKAQWAEFLGVPEPPISLLGDYSVTQTRLRGLPAPDADCRMAFFNLENIQLELIEPSPAPSAWREYLDEKGEGIHHYGYNVEDIKKSIENMKNAGFELIQNGTYGDGSGAYAYFDCREKLGCFCELLCSFKK